MTTSRVLFVFVIPLLLFGIAPAWGREPVSVFDQTGELIAPQESNPAVLRSRRLSGTLTGVRTVAVGDTLRLELFDDAIVMAVIEKVSVQGHGWALSGRIESQGASGPAGVLTAVVNDGLLSAIVETGARTYRIRSRDTTTHVVEEIDPARWPACGEPSSIQPPAGDGALAGPGWCSSMADDGSSIDVLVVYTPNAMNAVGGVEAITNEIELAVAVANAAYEASGIDTRLNLVHCALTDYAEDGSYTDHLWDMFGAHDGVMDEVPELRDEYGADLVSLIVDDDEFCGVAFRPSYKSAPIWAPYGYSVVTWWCAAGNKSLAHEIGHNQGCCHDHENTDCLDHNGELISIYDYAHGHRFIGDSGSEWRTVMGIFSGERIGHFSNPDVVYDGQPTGVADGPEAANNALTINNTSLMVANYRCSIPECPWDCGDDDGVVDTIDFLALLAEWGPNPGSPCDFNGDDVVDTVDFLDLLANWGPCPGPS